MALGIYRVLFILARIAPRLKVSSTAGLLWKMRHLDIRDIYLQQEVRDGRMEISNIPGEENPTDLVTKILGVRDLRERLERLGLSISDPSKPSSNSIMRIAAACASEDVPGLSPQKASQDFIHERLWR